MDLPTLFRQLTALAHHPGVLAAVGLGTVVMLVGGAVGAPWLVARLPADYFAGRERPHPRSPTRHPWRLVLLLLKNAAGLVLLLLGVAMLLLPGQGVLTILVAIGLLDFPGKWRLERWVVSRGPVHRLVSRVRQRAGRAPLILPDSD